MDRQIFSESCNRLFSSSKLNYISKEKALSDDLVSVKMFNEPIIAVTDASNYEFENLKREDVIGEHFMLPTEWLPEAKSVISFFFPFTETIRNSNKENMSYPSKGWLNGRIEGQQFINDFSACIVDFLDNNGFKSVSPSIDKKFFTNADFDENGINKLYTSNWSERHVAYVCGMGTFSLSKGLITDKGVAGRLTSVITDLHLLADDIKIKPFEENCIMCGKCIKNCPVNAISFEHGKNHKICSSFLNLVRSENSPRYGCGKCQVDVPCEYRNPNYVHIKKLGEAESQLKNGAELVDGETVLNKLRDKHGRKKA